MNDLTFEDNKIKFLGYFAFLLLLLLAYLFYLERTIMVDMAYQTFAMIHHDDFAIQGNRFGVVATRIFPYLAFKLGSALQSILITTSLSYILFPLVLYFCLIRILKNEYMGIVLLLFYTLMVGHTFYWIQSELIQACATILFFFGWVTSYPQLKNWMLLPLWGLVVIIIFFHPLSIIPFLFLWLFFFFKQLPKRDWRYYSLLIMAILIYMGKQLFIPTNSYDLTAHSAIYNLIDDFWSFFSFRSNRIFLQNCIREYYFFSILLIWLGIFYYRQKAKLKLALLLVFFLGYVTLINGSFPWGGVSFHIESFYQILTIFVAVPFVFDLLPALKNNKKTAFYLLLFMISIRIIHISFHRKVYKERLEWNLTMLEETKKMEGRKFLINMKDAPMDKIIMEWGTSFETLLLSAAVHPDSTRTFWVFNEDGMPLAEYLQKSNVILTNMGSIPMQELNKSYFNIRDTSRYELLSKDQLVE